MKKWIGVLLFLFTSISITGLSFLDNLVLNKIIAILATIAFGIVGCLYRGGFIDGRSEGSKAFKVVFVILLLFALIVYLGVRRFQEWSLTWPLYVKIIVPSALALLFAGILIMAVLDYLNNEDQCDH